MLRPVHRQSLSDAVFRQLREQILSGELAAGSSLPGERALAELLGVNRGAIREALKRLEQAGLVSIHHGGNTQVLDFRTSSAMDLLPQLIVDASGDVDATVVRSIVELRDAITPQIARLSALRSAAKIGPLLEAKSGELDAALGDIERVVTLRWEFWELLIEGSENLAYQLVSNTIRQVYELVRPRMVGEMGEVFGGIYGFREIAEAVAKGDVRLAEARGRDQCQYETRTMVRILTAAGRSPG